MISPKISVVMSVYNTSEFLERSIESILEQSFGDFEFIIIDDGSTDNSSEIIRNYGQKDVRIIVVNNKKNIGLPESLNGGLKIARGKYVARHDPDDISLENRLKIQYDYLERNPDIFLVGGGVINIRETGKKITVFKPIIDEVELKKGLEKGMVILRHPTVMFRNEKRIFFRGKFLYAQDYDFFLCLLSAGKRLINLPDVVLEYRIGRGAETFSKSGFQELFVRKAREFYFQRLKYGKDKYDEFDPDEILGIDVERTNSRIFLGREIEANFKRNSFKYVRKLYKRYMRINKIPDRYLVYYLASLLPESLVDFLRKIIWK